eukprot:Skav217506  [mRNA]  locus=scaffold1908:359432:363132:- [translate_table: standard]
MAALKFLLGFLVLGAASAETGHAEGAERKQNVSTAKEMLEPTADVSKNFLHCPCGLDCQKDLGKEHGFQLLQGCSCLSCNLRGAAESASPLEGSAGAGDFVALLAEQDQDWDAASVPGDSQLTFCRCGSLEKSCRSCEQTSKSRHGATCPCGSVCLKRLQWFGGNGWCIRRQCNSCR